MLTWIKAYLFYISCQMKFFPFYSQTQFCVVVFFISYISVLLPLQCTERETLPWLRSYSVRIAVFVYLRLCRFHQTEHDIPGWWFFFFFKKCKCYGCFQFTCDVQWGTNNLTSANICSFWICSVLFEFDNP